MAITTLNGLVDALGTQNRGYAIQFAKVTSGSTSADVWNSLWKAGNLPPAGGDLAVAGLTEAAVLTDANNGALIPIVNPSGGRKLYLVGGWVISNAIGTVALIDRIAGCRLVRNQATGSFSPVIDGTSRLYSGVGGRIDTEVTVALGATTTTRTFTYTDEGGASGSTGNITDSASRPVGLVLHSSRRLDPDLATGDQGVRSIESTTLGATGNATGEYHVYVSRELMRMPLGSNLTPFFWGPLSVQKRIEVFADSCLTFLFNGPSATNPLYVEGELYLVEG